MKKIFLFFLVALFSYTPYAKAQIQTRNTITTNGFVFTFNGLPIKVPLGLLQEWQHPVEFVQNNSITKNSKNPLTLIEHYTGQEKVNPEYKTENYQFDPGQIFNFIKNLSQKSDSEPIEPVLNIVGNKVINFTPPKDGVKIDIFKTLQNTLQNLNNNATSVNITTISISPKKSLGELNNLGIKELMAQGTSNFKGSPKNRIHNIQIGVNQMTGVIVGPGQEFSFNKNLGPVDGEHGFLPELVIKATGTVPEFGGGLCQVSSTVFRAAMQAGFPITQRRNHAYAVQYYSPQGTDATIYPGVIDLKFVNNSESSLLIWPDINEEKNILTFNFFGTKDNRQVTLDNPIQYDRKPDGSLKAIWQRTINKDGVEKIDVFKSTYQSPALFHKTEEFVKPSTTPISSYNVQ